MVHPALELGSRDNTTYNRHTDLPSPDYQNFPSPEGRRHVEAEAVPGRRNDPSGKEKEVAVDHNNTSNREGKT